MLDSFGTKRGVPAAQSSHARASMARMCSPIGLALSAGVFSAEDDRNHSSDCTGALPDPFDLTQGRSVDVNISGRRNGRRNP
ncbi:hypothetical protein Bxe_A2965 [Paraburkholderia xenovorans LB400]|uniref:Uncharacterized protein n=1 Tax=Paraburkholderia xenovorans (strain LB400) TaxID=266265 RepID=Q141H7_PARXL|nr:hypothetical protein Bxe_A2965 [Paraburkholderia xenovorans LB400]